MRIVLLTLGFFISCSLWSQWVQQSDFKGPERFSATNFTVNNKAYILGGTSQVGVNWQVYRDIWQYDSQKDTWESKGSYPGGNVYGGISFVIDSFCYLTLGANQNGVHTNQTWEFNASSKKWTRKADFPSFGRNFAFAFSANGKGYVGAGATFTSTGRIQRNDVWEYTPKQDTWIQKSNYPGNGRVGLICFNINDMVYLGSGDDGSFFYNDFYRYDPSNDQWSSLSAFPGVNRSFNQSISAVGIGYVIGGEQSDGIYTQEVWSYFPDNDEWKSSFNFAGISRGAANLFFVNNAFYYGLGLRSGSNLGMKDFWKFELPTTHIAKENGLTPISIYPNPIKDFVKVSLGKSYKNVNIYIKSIAGQLVSEYHYQNIKSTSIDLAQIQAGTYLLEVKAADKPLGVLRLVKF